MSQTPASTFDLLNTVVSIKTMVPDNAATAGNLGTHREGVGIRIGEDGLIATIGYLCLEASEIWLTNHEQQTAPGYLLAQDFESGIALLLPGTPIGSACLPLGGIDQLQRGDSLRILNGNDTPPFDCHLLSISEFAGRWEYLLDEALYTLPACDNWGGAGLLGPENALIGIGSLFLQFPGNNKPIYGNMFVPTQQIVEQLDHLKVHGRRNTPPRPWLGVFIDDESQQLRVTGVYANGPADRAGLKKGDQILAIAGARLRTLSGFLRTLWNLGQAGIPIYLSIMRDGENMDVLVESADRSAFFSEVNPGGLN